MKKLTSIVLSVLVVGLMLISPLSVLAQEGEEEITVEELGTGEIEINYWNGLTGSDGVYMVEMVKDFVEENPDIKVKMQMMPWGTYFDKIAAALVAGSGGPDVMIFWHSLVPQYALPGHILPIAEMMFESGMLDPEDFSPQLLDAVVVNGEHYTVPLDNYGVGIYVNVKLLERAGIDPNDPPENQEEFLEYARMLTWDVNGKHPGEEGFDPENVDVWAYNCGWPRACIQPALYQWGADIISHEDPPEILINSEGAIAATQFNVDLIYTHHVAPVPEGFNQSEAFVNDKLAMFADGSWTYNWANTQEGMEVILWPYPRLGPERGATIMWSHTFAVASNVEGEKLDASMRLIKYLSDHSNFWTANAGMPTARLSLRDESLKDQVWTLATFDTQFRAEGVMEFQSDRFSEIMGAVEPEWSAALTQQKTVEQALNDAAERIERILR